jgi:spore maturation protein CgeB
MGRGRGGIGPYYSAPPWSALIACLWNGVSMKILCVLGKHQYGRAALGEGIEYTAFSSALRRLGHEVLHFESWDRSVYPDYAELNKSLLDCVARERPHILLAVQRDCEIWTETLDTIRELGTTATVAWTTDDSWKYREVSRFIGRHYDAITTTYDYVVPRYRRDGIDNVLLTQWAANADWFQEPLPAAHCRYGVSFVGAAYGHRRAIIAKLRHRGITVECFGDGWPRGPILADDIPVIMRQSIVSLNFSNGYKRKTSHQIKARTFEVPGAGGLLLTEYTPGLERFYRLGDEILIYRTVDEMEAQIRYIRKHPEQRDAIARAGYLRTKAEHTYDRRLAEVLDFALKSKRRRRASVTGEAFSEVLRRHRVSFALARLRDFLTSACSAIWGPERGRRAARRAVFEISWRVFGEKTFASCSLPGRLFPEI